MFSFRSRALVGALTATGLTVAGLVATSPVVSATPPPTNEVFSTVGAHDFVVPAGVTEVTIEVRGAEGGTAGTNTGAPGGLGGAMTGTITVTPGETLKVHVGEAGQQGGDATYNGGGASSTGCSGYGGASGGGATDVRQGGDTLADRVIVAGGGGGGGGGSFSTTGAAGGSGGGATPTDGVDGTLFGQTYAAGDAPVGNNGGVRGTGGTGFEIAGADGAFGVGGDAGGDGCTTGGGGGGGAYGGGGGAGSIGDGAGGGGGGSGYMTLAGDLLSASDGVESGDGYAEISWVAPIVTTTTTTTTTAPTTTTTVPEPEQPAPAPACPSPHPPTKVETNAFGLAVAKYLIDNCGATGRPVTVGGSSFWVLDPPANHGCPTWAPVRVQPTNGSLLLGAYVVNSCRFTLHYQKDGKAMVPYVVPSGWPTGARV